MHHSYSPRRRIILRQALLHMLGNPYYSNFTFAHCFIECYQFSCDFSQKYISQLAKDYIILGIHLQQTSIIYMKCTLILKYSLEAQLLLFFLLTPVTSYQSTLYYTQDQYIEHNHPEASPFFSPDGNRLIIVQAGKALVFQSYAKFYVQTQTISVGFAINDIAWSADSRIFALRYFTNLDIYVERNGRFVVVQEFMQDDIVLKERMGLQFCKNSEYLVSPENFQILIYKHNDNSSNYELHESIISTGNETRISVTADCSRILASNTQQTQVYVMDNVRATESISFGDQQSRNILAISSDGKYLITEFNQMMHFWMSDPDQQYVLKHALSFANTISGVIRITKSLNTIITVSGEEYSVFGLKDGVYAHIFSTSLRVYDKARPSVDITAGGQKIALSYRVSEDKACTYINRLKIVGEIWNGTEVGDIVIIINMVGLAILTVLVISFACSSSKKPQIEYALPDQTED